MKEEILGAIDIGSNAIRLMISTIDENKSAKEFKKTAFLRVPIRLGEDVFTKEEISEEKKLRLCEALQGFSHLINAYNVDRYRACATSAMRDARNGKEIVDAIQKSSGIDIEIINGHEEADIIYQAGGLNKMMNKDRNYLYVDVGGGSTEIVLYSSQKKITSESFQLGTVRMLVDAVDEKEKERFKKWLAGIYKEYAPLSVIASGGNINKVFKLLDKKEGQYINYPELQVLYDTLKDMTYEERILNYKLKSYRADVIIPAMYIFTTICKICKVNEIFAPKVGLVDGIIHYLYNNK
jgi:Exopolyphosphatase